MSNNPLRLRALLIDLNGTLHIGSDPTPSAIKALKKLRQAQIPFLFCSNSTKESSASLLGKLRGMGFEARKEELLTSLGACKMLVEERGYRRPLLLMSPSAKEEFSGFSSSEEEGYDSVILGLHPESLSYEPLNKAFRALKGEPISTQTSQSSSKNPVLIAPHAAMYMQDAGSSSLAPGLSLGIGPFVKALEQAAETKAEIVGKPTKRFFELALEKLRELSGEKFEDGQVGVVGDDVENDLGEGARELGLKRILVKTGKYRPGAENAAEFPPDHEYETFADLVEDLC